MVKSIISATVCIVAFLSFACAISVNKCLNGGLVPEKVEVDACEEDGAICKIKFNGMFNITMEFKAPHYLESMKPKLIGKTALGEFNLTGKSTSKDDVCGDILNTFCPLVEKEVIEYRYSAKLAVLPLLPIVMEFSILDLELNETAICFTFNVSPTF